jgi:hypothetical protein
MPAETEISAEAWREGRPIAFVVPSLDRYLGHTPRGPGLMPTDAEISARGGGDGRWDQGPTPRPKYRPHLAWRPSNAG